MKGPKQGQKLNELVEDIQAEEDLERSYNSEEEGLGV